MDVGSSKVNRHAPEVWLNHVLLTLDSSTYAAARDSQFLRESFAGSEERHTKVDSGDSWTGLYFYGRHSYLEFFPPEDGSSDGSGIAFSVDRYGRPRTAGTIAGGGDGDCPRTRVEVTHA